MLFHGSALGDGVRIGAGAIVHANASIRSRGRVGLRQIACPGGDGAVITSDVDEAREALAAGAFFRAAFGVEEADQVSLHRTVIAAVRKELTGWSDELIPP